MTAISVLWFIAGMATGVVHVWVLWKASQPQSYGAAWHWTRLLIIGGVLVTAAASGGILPIAAGWAVAYFATVGIVATRKLT